MSDPIVWAVTTGEAGMRAQALGLAEALGHPFEERRIALRRPWRWLPGHLCPFPLMGLDAAHDILAPPWPDILITCGRRSTAVSIAIRKRSRGNTGVQQIKKTVSGPISSPRAAETANIRSAHCGILYQDPETRRSGLREGCKRIAKKWHGC